MADKKAKPEDKKKKSGKTMGDPVATIY